MQTVETAHFGSTKKFRSELVPNWLVWERARERERKERKGVRPPLECALRQVTALLSPAPLRLRMVCMGWGVWRGGEAGRERELSDRHCRPYAAGKQQKSLSTFPVWKKGGLQQLRWTKNSAVRFAHRFSKMSSTEATPESMVVVQQKDLTTTLYYYAYYINILKIFFLHFTYILSFAQVAALRHENVSSINTQNYKEYSSVLR